MIDADARQRSLEYVRYEINLDDINYHEFRSIKPEVLLKHKKEKIPLPNPPYTPYFNDVISHTVG